MVAVEVAVDFVPVLELGCDRPDPPNLQILAPTTTAQLQLQKKPIAHATQKTTVPHPTHNSYAAYNTCPPASAIDSGRTLGSGLGGSVSSV